MGEGWGAPEPAVRNAFLLREAVTLAGAKGPKVPAIQGAFPKSSIAGFAIKATNLASADEFVTKHCRSGFGA
jgi:hypothetical protein